MSLPNFTVRQILHSRIFHGGMVFKNMVSVSGDCSIFGFFFTNILDRISSSTSQAE